MQKSELRTSVSSPFQILILHLPDYLRGVEGWAAVATAARNMTGGRPDGTHREPIPTGFFWEQTLRGGHR